MPITMYDLAGAEAARRFSPFCWRARMALAHKGLAVETVPWRFTEKDKLAEPNDGRVPVIVDRERIVHNSVRSPITSKSTIRTARRCSAACLARPRAFCPELDRDGVADRPDPARGARHLEARRAADRDYFRTSREERFRTTLEEFVNDREARLPAFRASLDPLRRTIERQAFVSGDAPAYADYVVFGAFQWARRSATSNCWRRTIRCAPGAGACSTSTADWRGARPRLWQLNRGRKR